MLKNDRRNQLSQVLDALLMGDRLTAMSALARFNCARLAARIYDLRKQGHDIVTEHITRNGVTSLNIGWHQWKGSSAIRRSNEKRARSSDTTLARTAAVKMPWESTMTIRTAIAAKRIRQRNPVAKEMQRQPVRWRTKVKPSGKIYSRRRSKRYQQED